MPVAKHREILLIFGLYRPTHEVGTLKWREKSLWGVGSPLTPRPLWVVSLTL